MQSWVGSGRVGSSNPIGFESLWVGYKKWTMSISGFTCENVLPNRQSFLFRVPSAFSKSRFSSDDGIDINLSENTGSREGF